MGGNPRATVQAELYLLSRIFPDHPALLDRVLRLPHNFNGHHLPKLRVKGSPAEDLPAAGTPSIPADPWQSNE